MSDGRRFSEEDRRLLFQEARTRPVESGSPKGPVGRIELRTPLIRGERVMRNAGPAKLYGVGTKVLVLAVKRKAERFPRVEEAAPRYRVRRDPRNAT